jgi:microcin C transport system permease protein
MRVVRSKNSSCLDATGCDPRIYHAPLYALEHGAGRVPCAAFVSRAASPRDGLVTSYFLRRLLLIIPTFIGVSLLVFTLTRLVPGGPIERMLNEAAMAAQPGMNVVNTSGGKGGSTLSKEQLKELEAYYGFDKPIFVSYVDWLSKVVRLDLGTSTRYSEPVWDIIKSRFPISIFYGIVTLILTYGVCIPLGIVKAIRHKTLFDNVSSALIFFGYAIPGYVVGIALLTAFASKWNLFPLGGFVSDDFDDLSPHERVKDVFNHAVLPVLSYVAGSFAVTTMMMKNALMDNLAADYVRTAIAKGMTFRRAVFRHALRNSLVPISTSFGNNISLILTGSFLIEKIFDIDGFGLLGFESLVERDYPVVMGILVLSSLLFMLGNILSDLCVAIVDPRVKFGGSEASA